MAGEKRKAHAKKLERFLESFEPTQEIGAIEQCFEEIRPRPQGGIEKCERLLIAVRPRSE